MNDQLNFYMLDRCWTSWNFLLEKEIKCDCLKCSKCNSCCLICIDKDNEYSYEAIESSNNASNNSYYKNNKPSKQNMK